MMDLGNYYISVTGQICRTFRVEVFGVLFKPRVYVCEGLVIIGKNVDFDFKEVL